MLASSLQSTASPIASQRFATREAQARFDDKSSIREFTRNHAQSSRSTPASTTTSTVRDKGGIAPNNTTYGSMVSLAGEALSFWPTGTRWTSAIDLGPVNGQRTSFHTVRLQGIGNEIHAAVEKDGAILHNIRLFRDANNAAQVNLDGHLLNANSPPEQLEVARAVASAAANA
ncbi:hypothetical protein ACSFA3_02560 [Variovorax sp. RHLX14]|uniref:hypothetical protein n=1 Tax=Variovorax sp. RHLX14 TaxID=1259731 RepID=UPI003F46DF31